MSPSTYDEIKYLLSLCNHLTDEISDEILAYFEYHPNNTILEKLSPSCINFIERNLSVHPVAIMQILNKLKTSIYYNTYENEESLQHVIIEELMLMSESLNDDATVNKRHIVDCSLSVISEWDFNNYDKDTIDKIISKVYAIKSVGYGKELYLSVLGQNTQCMITALMEYEKEHPSLMSWPLNPDLMIELCFGFKKHWLLESISHFSTLLESNNDLPVYSDNITQKVWQLTLINFMNSQNKSPLVALERLKAFFSFIDYQNCEDNLFVYFNEIYRELNLFSFCINNSKKKHFLGWCEVMKNHSALSVISKMCDLSQLDRFKVKQALNLNTELLMKIKDSKEKFEPHKHWDIMTYNAYCIITSVIDIIILNSNPHTEAEQQNPLSNLDEIKLMILNVQPVKFRIEVLKNIFACLFLRYEYFSNEDCKRTAKSAVYSDNSYFIQDAKKTKLLTDYQGFMCKSDLVKDILHMLKDCLTKLHDGLKINSGELNNVDLEDFNQLQSYVTNAIWKWQLMTNMKVENWDSISMPSLYNSLIDLSSEEENLYNSPSRKKNSNKLRKRRSKSYNENLFSLSKKNKVIDLRHKCEILEPDFMSLMLSSPDTMIALSLESNDFSKAYKIIEVYDLTDSDIFAEISYTEQFAAITSHVKDTAIISEHLAANSASTSTTTIIAQLENFIDKQKQPYNYQLLDLIQTFPQLQVYENVNSPIVTIIDLLVSTGVNRDITLSVINIAEGKCHEINGDFNGKHNSFTIFMRNVIDILYDKFDRDSTDDLTTTMKTLGVCDLLSNEKIPFRHKDYVHFRSCQKDISKLYVELNNSNIASISDCDLLVDSTVKLRKLLINSAFDYDSTRSPNVSSYHEKSDLSYLRSLFTYIQNISTLLSLGSDEVQNEAEVNFDLLELKIHDIIGFLMTEKSVSVENIEPVCKKLGINIIHKIVLNYCPPIKCSFEKLDKMDSFDGLIQLLDGRNDKRDISTIEEVILAAPSVEILTYIHVHNWVVASLLKRIHSDTSEQESQRSRMKFLDNYLKQDRFDVLKDMYSGNKSIAGLQTDFDFDRVYLHLKRLIQVDDLHQCLKVIDALPERLLVNKCLVYLKDYILMKLCAREDDDNNWTYYLMISNEELRTSYIFECLKFWNYEGVMQVLQFYYNQFSGLVDAQRAECKKWINSIPLYEKISKYLGDTTWYQVYKTSVDDPELVLQVLMDVTEYELCLQWTHLHEVSENVKNLVITSLVKQVILSSVQLMTINLNTLLLELPSNDSINICKENLFKMRDLETMTVVVKFLLQYAPNPSQFHSTWVGIQCLLAMDPGDRPLFWDLVHKPLLIVEQYLMNAKFEKLTRLLSKIKTYIKPDPIGDNLYYNMYLINTIPISINAIDALLKLYASKALDLKSSKTKSNTSPASKEEMLQSIDSINLVGNPIAFVMPEAIPSREDWVPNNQTSSCMVCKTTIFSIIVRRHHCRRCGRIVCYSCSRQKLQLASEFYTNLKVRVCDECYIQTVKKAEFDQQDRAHTLAGSSSIKSDTPSLEWCLTADHVLNEEIRREFIYEFSPNVNLCLTIMKLHTVNVDYPRFLLDKGIELTRIASETDEGVLELMHMRRALLLSCAVLYTRSLLGATISRTETALAHTERQLANTDALTQLATQGCQSMMPEVDLIDTHYIRRLLTTEKFELALDISTKFNLPKVGVLAAWGKSCLRAGCFDQARQKFALCFKAGLTSYMPNIIVDAPKAATSPSEKQIKWQSRKSDMNTSATQFDLYKSKNIPSLLDEIVSLLELTSYTMNDQILKEAETIKNQVGNMSPLSPTAKKIKMSEPAINVMHALSRVSKIKEGDFSDFVTNSQFKWKLPIAMKKAEKVDKYEFKRSMEPFFYNECLFYLMNYGSPNATINFYLKYGKLSEALQYCHDSNVDKDIFIEHIFLKYIKGNDIDILLKVMHDIDNTWKIWTTYLMYGCRILEKRGCLETLHLLQTGIGDHVRAAITCVNMYTKPTQSPHINLLHSRSHHLAHAKGHLQHVPRKTSITENTASSCLQLKMDAASLEKHINTFVRQIDLVAYLNVCEMANTLTEKMIKDVVTFVANPDEVVNDKCFVPTLFGTYMQKIQVCVLLLIADVNVKKSFGTVVKIIKEHNLDTLKVYNFTVRYLINKEKVDEVVELIDAIKSVYDERSPAISDGVIESSVAATVRRCDAKGRLFDEVADLFIAKTENLTVKISCYIECRQLKLAKSLAIKHNNPNDLKRVERACETLGISLGKKC
ncbi:zinc finger FYVE-type containing 26 spastizin [Arctopsyche grandis]|uniref:zinc finger FYVE-type containing 26 spastizin n=1 Tax=Arctopsyche grandis TaxID=121162 RepID=UPI00406D7855